MFRRWLGLNEGIRAGLWSARTGGLVRREKISLSLSFCRYSESRLCEDRMAICKLGREHSTEMEP